MRVEEKSTQPSQSIEKRLCLAQQTQDECWAGPPNLNHSHFVQVLVLSQKWAILKCVSDPA